MHNEIMRDLEKVFNTLSRIPVSDIGVDLMYSAKEQLKAIYAKLAEQKDDKEDVR
jgi:hypothetical protein